MTVSMALLAVMRAVDRHLTAYGRREWFWNDYASHVLGDLQRILGVDLTKPK